LVVVNVEDDELVLSTKLKFVEFRDNLSSDLNTGRHLVGGEGQDRPLASRLATKIWRNSILIISDKHRYAKGKDLVMRAQRRS